MKKKIYITFSGDAYHETTKKIVEKSPTLGVDEVLVYDDWWLKNDQKEFCKKNKWAFDHHHKRGFGWYIWKPYVIWHALNNAKDGDIVLFTDADTYPVKNLDVLYNICEQDGGVMLFSAAGHNQRNWCKRDCYITMNQDDPKYYDTQHGVARFVLIQKGKKLPMQFIDEWLKFTCTPEANTFDKSVLGPEIPGFIEHRCEQAIMTNLAHKYGFRLYREACQAGEHYSYDKDLFPTLFHQDGTVASKYKNTTVPCLGSKFRNV